MVLSISLDRNGLLTNPLEADSMACFLSSSRAAPLEIDFESRSVIWLTFTSDMTAVLLNDPANHGKSTDQLAWQAYPLR
jgi:hypothetical protein